MSSAGIVAWTAEVSSISNSITTYFVLYALASSIDGNARVDLDLLCLGLTFLSDHSSTHSRYG